MKGREGYDGDPGCGLEGGAGQQASLTASGSGAHLARVLGIVYQWQTPPQRDSLPRRDSPRRAPADHPYRQFCTPQLFPRAQSAGASSRHGSSGCLSAPGQTVRRARGPEGERPGSRLPVRAGRGGASRALTEKSWKPVREKVPSSSSRSPARSIAPPAAAL